MELQIKSELRDKTAIVYIKGEIDMYNATALKDRVVSIVDDDGPKCLVLDLQQVEYIDSTGLGILIGIRRRMIEAGGEIRLVIVSPRMTRLFDVTGLSKVFGVYKDAEAAIAENPKG